MQSILLIDDDIELTEMLAEYLNLEGFEVSCAHDGESGAQKAISEIYEVIVLDVMLPKLNGFDALRAQDLITSETNDFSGTAT